MFIKWYPPKTQFFLKLTVAPHQILYTSSTMMYPTIAYNVIQHNRIIQYIYIYIYMYA